MKKSVRIICIISLIAITAIISYQFGLSTGFGRGYEYQSIHSGPSHGLVNVVALKKLRVGEIEKAIELLENTLDSNIITHGIGINGGDPPIPFSLIFPNIRESEKKIMNQVAKYRKEHPSLSTDPEVKNAINVAVNYYLQKKAF